MNFIKVAGRDIASIFKNRIIRVSVIAIIIVPLLYSLLYLAAFWDPYNRLSTMPVAVVNLDKGSTKDGTAVNYGSDTVEKLKDNNKVGWRFVSLEEAQSGVKKSNGGYYGMFIIPEDFSQKILSAKDGKPEKPAITFTENEKKNFLAAQINGKVLLALKEEINKSITDEYTKTTFDSLYEVKDGMIAAADGSKQLKDGLETAKDGSGALKDGTSKLNSSVPELKDGVSKLKDGSLQLNDGLSQAKSGTAQLYFGANTLSSAIGQAKTGFAQIFGGLGQLNSKIPDLTDGTKKLNDGSSDLKNGLGQLNSGISSLNDAVNTTAKDASGNPIGLVSGVKALGSGVDQINTAVNTALTDANGNPVGLANGIASLNTAINTNATDANGNPLGLANGMAALNTAINTTAKDVNGNPLGLADGVNKLNDSVIKLGAGTQKLYDGLTTVNADPTKDGLADTLKNVQALLNAGDAVSLANAKALMAGLVATTSTHSADPINSPTMLDAVTMLNDGVNNSNTAYNPGTSLKAAVSTLNTGVNVATINSQGKQGPSLKAAVSTLNTGINTATINASGKQGPSLKAAVASINTGVNGGAGYTGTTLKDGLQTLNASVNGVKDASGNIIKSGLVQGVNTLGQSVSGQLLPGAQKLYDGSKQLNDGLASLNSKVPELASGVGKLYDGSNEFNTGIGQIYAGSSQLANSIATADQVKDIAQKTTTSTDTLFGGLTKLNDGSSQLATGLTTLNGKVPELADGTAKLADGSSQLYDGMLKLASGSTELNDKLGEGANKITNNLKNDSKTMGEFVSEPSTIDEKPMYSVKNYGTGFTPYFIPLSLWVGAMLMFFVITDDTDEDIREKASSRSLVLGKYVCYVVIGAVQAILASAIVLTLGLKPDNMMLYFATNILMSFTFIAIIQCLVFLLGQAGRMLGIVLLIFQLTTCAGTFPLETVPGFFSALNPYLPFTYCISALREVISGLDYSVYTKDMSILAVTLVAFLFISVVLKGHADKVKERIREKSEATNVA